MTAAVYNSNPWDKKTYSPSDFLRSRGPARRSESDYMGVEAAEAHMRAWAEARNRRIQ